MGWSEVLSIQLAGWVACATFIIGGLHQLLKLMDRFKEQPPPSQTYQPKGDYVTRTEFRQLRSEISGQLNGIIQDVGSIRREMKEDYNRIMKADEERAAKIHDRINTVLSSVSRLEGSRDKHR